MGCDVYSENNAPLRWASFAGYFKIVKFLYEHGADVTVYYYWPIRWAFHHGHVDIVKFFYEREGIRQLENDYFVKLASRNGQLEIIKFIFEKGGLKESKLKKREKKYIEIYKRNEEKKKIKAVNKIGTWWIPICYKLKDENGELRMAKKSWKKLYSV